jgi:hypothetical protein
MIITENDDYIVSYCLNWRHSLICIDLNSEMFNMAAGFRHGFSHIFKLSLNDKNALKFNILDEIPEQSAYQSASMIADVFLTQIEPKADFRSNLIIDKAKDLLTAAILHCKCSDYRDKSMYGVLSFLLLAGKENGNIEQNISFFDCIIDSIHCSNEIHKLICDIVMGLKCITKNKFQYIFNYVLKSLKIFEDPIIQNLTSSSDFCINDFKAFDRPISLFITIPSSYFERFFVYFASLLNMLYYSITDDKMKDSNILKNPILILLDEYLNNKNYFKNIHNDYCSDITLCYSKFNSTDIKNKSFEFLYRNDKESLPKKRNDLLLECVNTTMPDLESKKWFHIPEEVYMSENSIIEPLFTSSIPDENDLKEIYMNHFDQENNEKKYKDMEFINYRNINDIDLFFNKELTEHIDKLESILQLDKYNEIKKRFIAIKQNCGIICMLFGEPGTGKSEVVLQLAKKTKRNILKVDLSIIRKRYVGESEKAINKMFSSYKDIYGTSDIAPILFINEADGVFQKRLSNIEDSTNPTLALDINTIQNLLLDKLECFEGIMIGTSNFIENMDGAFDRRILYKINFSRPESETQKKIWKKRLPELNGKIIEKQDNKYNFTG